MSMFLTIKVSFNVAHEAVNVGDLDRSGMKSLKFFLIRKHVMRRLSFSFVLL